jgi:hypothetical protein
MFSSDLFTFVESFLGAATSFFYSYIFSVAVLIRHPKVGPFYLQRCYARDGVKQIGPLSLHFISLIVSLFVVTQWAFGTRKSFDSFQSQDNLQSIDNVVFDLFTNADQRSGLWSLMVGALVGTALIDLIARCAVLLGWPAKSPVRGYTLLNSRARRIAADYALFMPVSLGSAVILIGFYILSKSDSEKNNLLVFGLSTLIIGPLIVVRISSVHFLQMMNIGKSGIHSKRLFLLVMREFFLPFSFVVTIFFVVKAYLMVVETYRDNDIYRPSVEREISIFDFKCDLIDQNEVKYHALVYNRGKGIAILKTGWFRVLGADANIDPNKMLPSQIFPLESNVVISSNNFVQINGTANVKQGVRKFSGCDISWGLLPGGYVSVVAPTSERSVP